MIVKVCDTIMGAGKTESAITLMNQDKESRYVFITPYLDESNGVAVGENSKIRKVKVRVSWKTCITFCL